MNSESTNSARIVQIISDDEDHGKENRAPNKILGKRKFALQDITAEFNQSK